MEVLGEEWWLINVKEMIKVENHKFEIMLAL